MTSDIDVDMLFLSFGFLSFFLSDLLFRLLFIFL